MLFPFSERRKRVRLYSETLKKSKKIYVVKLFISNTFRSVRKIAKNDY